MDMEFMKVRFDFCRLHKAVAPRGGCHLKEA